MCVYIYIYIERERDIDTCIYICTCTHSIHHTYRVRLDVLEEHRAARADARQGIVAIFYPFSQFCEIDIALLSS